MSALTEFRVTFGAEPHTLFPEARPDSWVTILAPDEQAARQVAVAHLGRQRCDIYSPVDVANLEGESRSLWAEIFFGRELARWSE